MGPKIGETATVFCGLDCQRVCAYVSHEAIVPQGDRRRERHGLVADFVRQIARLFEPAASKKAKDR
jgi:hypothetical protein